eukprot:3196625-Lingulodinium_polyedra.AAC.1
MAPNVIEMLQAGATCPISVDDAGSIEPSLHTQQTRAEFQVEIPAAQPGPGTDNIEDCSPDTMLKDEHDTAGQARMQLFIDEVA